jgi:hypothetical protein
LSAVPVTNRSLYVECIGSSGIFGSAVNSPDGQSASRQLLIAPELPTPTYKSILHDVLFVDQVKRNNSLPFLSIC